MATKYKQQSDGRWKTRVWDGTVRDGKKHYVWLTSSKSSKDLEKMVIDYVNKRDSGKLAISKNISVQEYAYQWLSTKKSLREKATQDSYRYIIKVYLSEMEHLPFEYFTAQNVQSIINANADKPRTCRKIGLTLKQISKSAEVDRLIPAGRTNEIFDNLQFPKYRVAERKPLTDEECRIVLNALQRNVFTPREALYVSLIYFCGLRRQEALAVKNEDISGTSVTVNKALHIGKHGSDVKGPKSERGYRVVPLPDIAIPIIRDAIKELTPNDDGYLITMRNGKVLSETGYDRMWESIRDKLGFQCTAHAFRHTYCTNLCFESFKNRTISQKEIARLLGDSEKMVIDVYSHLIAEREQTSVALQSVFGGVSVNQMSTNT